MAKKQKREEQRQQEGGKGGPQSTWEEQGRQRVREEAERLSANIAKGKDAKCTEDGMGKDDKSKDGKDGASSFWNGCEVHQSKLQSCHECRAIDRQLDTTAAAAHKGQDGKGKEDGKSKDGNGKEGCKSIKGKAKDGKRSNGKDDSKGEEDGNGHGGQGQAWQGQGWQGQGQ